MPANRKSPTPRARRQSRKTLLDQKGERKRPAAKRTNRKPPATPKPTAEATTIPVTWLKFVLGIFLLPWCWITTAALIRTFANPSHPGIWQSESLWFLSLGALIWTIAFFTIPRPTGIYVIGHELTHAIFIWMHGGRVGKMHFTHQGGYVITDKTNTLISLSPYFVPFYSVISVALLAVTHLLIDIPWFHRVLFFTVGLTWAFHITFTIAMIHREQSDLKDNGILFSIVLIYLVNLLLITLLLILASPEIPMRAYAQAYATETAALIRTTIELIR